ncbi:MAG TPA: recombinase family protein [Solirubrobacteraceae bacterium]|jgi:site-specific DNA recombinase|nr:recombinase family protein [Solirubrobacteraceae bacterium]
MPQSQTKPQPPNPETEPAEAAAIYVRVSSTGQLGRDGDEDGYSIPAQVEACEKEAASRGAVVAKVYIERAESAKSDDRPVLQYMLRELPSLGVKYLIVHKVDRLARNRLDDATLYQKLVGMGIKLVSASENIDETPAGQLMHGMLATFAEYYSNNLATEIMKGLRRKHEQGGTPFKPPIGYQSKRELIGAQDIRSVIVDPVRSPLVKLAFTLYSTGEWPLHRLAAHLEEQGLRSRGTRRYPERPLGANRINSMLRNPYYIGIVVWNGQRYAGKHDRLIDEDTFDKVQGLLTAANQKGERPQKHRHYLRGTVVCDECLGRLLYGRHRGRSGRQYEYFCCNNRTARRRKAQCSSGHASVPTVEEGVLALYRTLRLDPKVQEQIRAELRQELTDRTGLIQREAERHERALKAIESKQEKLVQLFYKDLVTEDVFAAEQAKLKDERRAAKHLQAAATAQLDDVQAALDLALSRIKAPYDVYHDGTEMERRIMNRAIFEHIEVGEEGHITGTALTPVYDALSAWQPGLGRPQAQRQGSQHQTRQCSPYVRPATAPVHVAVVNANRRDTEGWFDVIACVYADSVDHGLEHGLGARGCAVPQRRLKRVA